MPPQCHNPSAAKSLDPIVIAELGLIFANNKNMVRKLLQKYCNIFSETIAIDIAIILLEHITA